MQPFVRAQIAVECFTPPLGVTFVRAAKALRYLFRSCLYTLNEDEWTQVSVLSKEIILLLFLLIFCAISTES